MDQLARDIQTLSKMALTPAPDPDRARLDRMNAQVAQLEREGRDRDAWNLAARADALARRMFRRAAA